MRSVRGIVWLVAVLSTQYSVLSTAHAHPVPRDNHARVIVVRLSADAVVVDYHLEVDAFTVYRELAALHDKVDLLQVTGPQKAVEEYARLHAPILADNLDARLDGKPLKFTLVERKQQVADSYQMDFRFRAAWSSAPGTHEFTFIEGNYAFPDRGQIDVTLTADESVTLSDKREPDAA